MSKVLVVDDEPGFIEMVSNFLAPRGFTLISAGNGEEGLKRFDAESPDAILLDIRMPKKDGYAFLKEVRQKGRWVPVIVVSALAEMKDVFKGYEFEADDYLTKPVNLENLARTLQFMISLIPLRKVP